MTVGLPGHRRFGIDDGRQRVVVDDDRVGGIAREVAIARDDDGDRLAGVAHGVDGHRMMRRRRERRADRHRRQELRRCRAPVKTASTPSIASAALVSIERDASVRDVAALERQVQHAGELDVVDVGAAALDQARIFAALDALRRPASAGRE